MTPAATYNELDMIPVLIDYIILSPNIIKFKTLVGKIEMIDVKIDQNHFFDLYN